MEYLVIYLIGYFLAYYTGRYIIRIEAGKDYNWKDVKGIAFFSILSYFSFLGFLIAYIIGKIKYNKNPPKWL